MKSSRGSSQERIMLPIRLSPEIYQKIRRRVNNRKDEVRGYSINKYLTELVIKDLEGEA